MLPRILRIRAPFDTHVHLRWDFNIMRMVLKHLVEQGIRYIIVEPNPKVSDTQDGIYTWQQAEEYKRRIEKALEANGDKGKLKFIVAIKVTPHTRPQDIWEAAERGYTVFKIYAGITTGSEGIMSLEPMYGCFAAMEEINAQVGRRFERPVVQQLHGESADPDVVIHQKEFHFNGKMSEAFRRFTSAFFSVEHISDRRTLEMVEIIGEHVRGALTPQHSMIWMNDIFYQTKPNGDQHPGLRPTNFFLPCAKEKEDMLAIRAARSHEKFHLGSDTAPHDARTKLCDCGSAGAYLGPYIVPFEVNLADEVGDLGFAEPFTSTRACEFYGIQHDGSMIELVSDGMEQQIPEAYDIPGGADRVLSFLKGRPLNWRVHRIELVD